MNVEQTLTAELRHVADALAPPVPPTAAELVRAADRDRARTRLTRLGGAVLVAAVVVAAVVIGIQVGDPESSPAPAEPNGTEMPLPTGAPPRIPYVQDNVLYVDGQAQPGDWSGAVTIGGTTVARLGPEDSGPNPVVVFRHGVEVARLTKLGTEPVVSPDGTKVAWIEHDATAATLVVHDVEDGRSLGRLGVDRAAYVHDGAESEAWENLDAVADDGTVTYGGVVTTHRWTPGSGPVDTPARYDDLFVPGFPKNIGRPHLRADGLWGAWLTDSTGDSAPGAQGTGALDGITLQQPGDRGSRFTIALPADSDGRLIQWETTTDLLVTVFEDRDGSTWHFLRCTITDQHCEYVPTTATP